MKRIVAAAFFALAACSPAATTTTQTTATAAAGSPEALVQGIYAEAQHNLGTPTPETIPMTDDLKSLFDRAEAAAAARHEPFIEGDLALNCQDCTSVSDLFIGPQTGAEQEPAVAGHQWVQAKFKLNGNEDRTILWDLVQGAQGWRVDNILTEGFNLRTEANDYISGPTSTAPSSPDNAP